MPITNAGLCLDFSVVYALSDYVFVAFRYLIWCSDMDCIRLNMKCILCRFKLLFGLDAK